METCIWIWTSRARIRIREIRIQIATFLKVRLGWRFALTDAISHLRFLGDLFSRARGWAKKAAKPKLASYGPIGCAKLQKKVFPWKQHKMET